MFSSYYSKQKKKMVRRGGKVREFFSEDIMYY